MYSINNANKNNEYKNVILVQGAMDIEVNTVISNLDYIKKQKYGSWIFFIGNIECKNGLNRVIVSRTEQGLVNASAATVIGIEKYKPDIIIDHSTSGVHDINLHIGDIVLGTNIVNIGAFMTKESEKSEQKNL